MGNSLGHFQRNGFQRENNFQKSFQTPKTHHLNKEKSRTNGRAFCSNTLNQPQWQSNSNKFQESKEKPTKHSNATSSINLFYIMCRDGKTKFLIDTGAGVSILKKEVGQNFEIKTIKPMKI